MTLPPRLHEKYVVRFEELIAEGEGILMGADTQHTPGVMTASGSFVLDPPRTSRHIDNTRFHQWQTNCASLLTQLIPEGSVHWQFANSIGRYAPGYDACERSLAKLRAIKADYERGFLGNLQTLVRAELATDYLGQSRVLLSSGYHVPATVLAGAVLEDTLRKLCVEHHIPTETDGGRRKTIDPMNTELVKANVYNAAKGAEIRGWAALRNDAAHGQIGTIDPQAIERMVAGVQSFIGQVLN